MEDLNNIVGKQKQICQFKELDFGSFDNDWQEIKETLGQEDSYVEKPFSFCEKIKWEDKDLFINALKVLTFKEGKITIESLTFRLSFDKENIGVNEEDGFTFDGGDSPYIEFSLKIYYKNNPYPSIETSIEKNDLEKKLPSKMATSIYDKIFEYIQSRANKDNQIYSHRIERETSISKQEPLSDERWNEIFLPIIEKGGYKEYGSGGFWTKDYKPE